MKPQTAPHGILWTKVWGRAGFTWNPITGCRHACEWEMPDGGKTQCYAKTIAEGIAEPYYPDGFAALQFHRKRMEAPIKRKTGAGIFANSMGDTFGVDVPDWQIQRVLDVCRQTPQHIYFMLTKNAPRLLDYTFPDNVWVGVSMPPSSMNGKVMTPNQQSLWLNRAFSVLSKVKAKTTWCSFEPLSFDPSDILSMHRGVLDWAVIGAASRGKQLFQPAHAHLIALLDELDAGGVPVHFKSNLRFHPWRTEFPTQPTTPSPVIYQETLF